MSVDITDVHRMTTQLISLKIFFCHPSSDILDVKCLLGHALEQPVTPWTNVRMMDRVVPLDQRLPGSKAQHYPRTHDVVVLDRDISPSPLERGKFQKYVHLLELRNGRSIRLWTIF